MTYEQLFVFQSQNGLDNTAGREQEESLATVRMMKLTLILSQVDETEIIISAVGATILRARYETVHGEVHRPRPVHAPSTAQLSGLEYLVGHECPPHLEFAI